MSRRILATCGGWTPAEWGDVEFSPLQRYALELTGVVGRRIRLDADGASLDRLSVRAWNADAVRPS